MVRRRVSGLDLNFDSLTDVVTNLVGGLILLIIMVIGATQPAAIGLTYLPPPENKPGGDRSMDRLLEEIRSSQQTLEQVNQDIRRVEARLPELAGELEELERRAQKNTAPRSTP
jgi:TolA-binding protein